jgi:antitoxin HicB
MPIAYPVRLTPDAGVGILVTCRDLPELLTWGDDEAEALAMAADALEVVIAATLAEGRPVPRPSEALPGERLIALPPGLAERVVDNRQAG